MVTNWYERTERPLPITAQDDATAALATTVARRPVSVFSAGRFVSNHLYVPLTVDPNT